MKFVRDHKNGRVLPIDITPMIDVVFLLIIFFMVTAQFARTTRAAVDLPLEAGEKDELSEEAGLVINIDRHGGIVIENEITTIDGLRTIVLQALNKSADPDPGSFKLLLRADRRADTTALNQVITMLNGEGIGVARMATEVPKGARR